MKALLQVLREIRQIEPAFWTALVALGALGLAGYAMWLTRVS